MSGPGVVSYRKTLLLSAPRVKRPHGSAIAPGTQLAVERRSELSREVAGDREGGLDVAGIAPAVGKRSLEVQAVARLELEGLAADHDFEGALLADHDLLAPNREGAPS